MTDPEQPPQLPPAADPYQPDPPIAVPAAQDYPTAPQDYPTPAQDYPTSPVVAAPPAYGYPPVYPPSMALPPRRKGKALKIILVSLAIVSALCASGSAAAVIWAYNKDAQPSGAVSPEKATEEFLTAYYRSQDPARAKKAVCAEARDDEKIAAQIAEVKAYASKYEKPSFTWDPPKIARSGDKATVSVDLIVTTEDMKSAKQKLTLDAVNDKGWWICAVRPQ